jgi:hypothetical protein
MKGHPYDSRHVIKGKRLELAMTPGELVMYIPPCAATNLRLKCLSPCSATSVYRLQAKAGASERNPRTAALARATQGCLQMQSPPLGSVETRSHHALRSGPLFHRLSAKNDLPCNHMHRHPTLGVKGSKPRLPGTRTNGKPASKTEVSRLSREYLEIRNRQMHAKT